MLTDILIVLEVLDGRQVALIVHAVLILVVRELGKARVLEVALGRREVAVLRRHEVIDLAVLCKRSGGEHKSAVSRLVSEPRAA